MDTTPVREHPRIYVEVPAKLSAPIEGGIFAALLTHQLGKGGCMLKGIDRINPGRIVKVILDLDGMKISAISQILYEYESKGLVMSGVKFLDIEPVYAKILEEFILRNAKDESTEGINGAVPAPVI